MHSKLEVKLVRASDLNEAPYNPRFISDDQFEALKQSIREHGMIQPLLVQRKGFVIIAGHQRLKAFLAVEAEDPQGSRDPKVSVVFLDVDDAQAKRLNLRLNRVGGEFDAEKLGRLLQEDDFPKDFDFEELGFTQREIQQALKTVSPPPLEDPKVPIFGRSVTLSLEFGDVETRDLVKQWLTDQAKALGKRTGEVVQGLIRKASKGSRTKRSVKEPEPIEDDA